MVQRFQRGDEVIVRYRNTIAGFDRAQTARMVEDSESRTVLHVAAFSQYREGVWVGKWPPSQLHGDTFRDGTWTHYSMLRIMYPDVPYSVWPMWDANSGEFVQWYVNIESPFTRTELGFDVADYELDIVVSPDLAWRWKDEAELLEWVRIGLFTEQQAKQFREYGLDAVRRIETGAAPFNEPWPEWQPAVDWGPQAMPPDEVWMREL